MNAIKKQYRNQQLTNGMKQLEGKKLSRMSAAITPFCKCLD